MFLLQQRMSEEWCVQVCELTSQIINSQQQHTLYTFVFSFFCVGTLNTNMLVDGGFFARHMCQSSCRSIEFPRRPSCVKKNLVESSLKILTKGSRRASKTFSWQWKGVVGWLNFWNFHKNTKLKLYFTLMMSEDYFRNQFLLAGNFFFWSTP